MEQKINNLKIVINANGWGAYLPISLSSLTRKIRGFGYDIVTVDGHNTCQLHQALRLKIKNKPSLIFAKTKVEQFPFLKGLDAHYYVMNKADYEKALNILK